VVRERPARSSLACGIVDLAHLVTIHAIAEGDLNRAQRATQIAASAAPY
jgi:hypothetical protein